ncbi:hypothetical protein phiPsa347_031 [Pseudomonas phage phiPsa347]|uniref:Uncharacterized protein n=1 Tax=Pseudomonas phage phiPsa347 TaxID=1460364 RepID=A0A7G9V2D5_9CAUD|nr:hypothetical protein QGX18_gp031 [Pseudomonas phage phiPsa347]QNO00441.1 hypothetical protein phiPsa347_031 [Pseudomonas phage phiPsa347]
MELFIMAGIGAFTLFLIWLIVREPVKLATREASVSAELFRPQPTVTPISAFAIEMAKAETAQEARVNAGIPRAYVKPVEKPVDKPKPKSYSSSSSRSSSGGSSYSSRSDDSYSSYSSWGGDSSSSSSSSCDSSSSSSSSSSCD